MKHRFAARLRWIGGARSGLLAVLALNAVILPCAMAVGLDDHSCIHAQSVRQHDMAGHHGRHEQSTHDGADSQCCVVEAASVDSRFGQQKVRDAGDWDAAPVAQAVAPDTCPVLRTEPIERPPDQPGASPPRHKLFCVYLD